MENGVCRWERVWLGVAGGELLGDGVGVRDWLRNCEYYDIFYFFCILIECD